MFAGPEDDPEATRFEIFDLQMLLGYGLIAWAFALSVGLAMWLCS